jgi:hypothetical protein
MLVFTENRISAEREFCPDRERVEGLVVGLVHQTGVLGEV